MGNWAHLYIHLNVSDAKELTHACNNICTYIELTDTRSIYMHIYIYAHITPTCIYICRRRHIYIYRGDEMRNIAPSAGIEPTSLAFWTRVLTILPPSLRDVTILSTHTCLCMYIYMHI